ncbi:MAG: hypothetical protein WC770_03475 [Phycisphaerae bacterium]|jgi:hypothetical protein
MDEKINKNGFVMIMVLATFVIIAILFMMNMPGSFLHIRGNEQFDVFAEQPWFEEQRLLSSDAFPVKQTGKDGKAVIEKSTILKGSISRKGENRGQIEITITPDGKVVGKNSCQYEYTDSSYRITAEFAGNIDPTKIFKNKDGKNKKPLYFITKGKYEQIKTDKAGKGSWTTNKNVYVVGWIEPDYSARGKVFFMTSEGNDNEDNGNAEYDWQTNRN